MLNNTCEGELDDINKINTIVVIRFVDPLVPFVERSGKLTIDSLRTLCKQFELKLQDEELVDMVNANMNPKSLF